MTDTPPTVSPRRVDPPAATDVGPIRERDRIEALDTLRGVALFGVFLMNMPLFALPLMVGFGDSSLADGPAVDRAAWSIGYALFAYKFISLFSLLFGMGIAVQSQRADAAGRPFAWAYLRRLAVLALIGMTHALALWYGDILFMYACLGVLLIPARHLSWKMLAIAAVVVFLIGVLVSTSMMALQMISMEMADLPPVVVPETVPRGFAGMKAGGFDPANPIWIAAEEQAYRDGPFLDAFAFRASCWIYSVLSSFFGYGWHVLSLFLAGAALIKAGFFEPGRRHWHVRLAIVGLTIGLPLEVTGTLVKASKGWEFGRIDILLTAMREFGSVSLCLGYLGLVTLWVDSGVAARLARAIAALGRMALTGYLSQTIIATAIMYWWGLAQFGRHGHAALALMVIAIYVFQVAAANAWLSLFRMGPAEWVWRSITYWRLQPLRRSAG